MTVADVCNIKKVISISLCLIAIGCITVSAQEQTNADTPTIDINIPVSVGYNIPFEYTIRETERFYLRGFDVTVPVQLLLETEGAIGVGLESGIGVVTAQHTHVSPSLDRGVTYKTNWKLRIPLTMVTKYTFDNFYIVLLSGAAVLIDLTGEYLYDSPVFSNPLTVYASQVIFDIGARFGLPISTDGLSIFIETRYALPFGIGIGVTRDTDTIRSITDTDAGVYQQHRNTLRVALGLAIDLQWE